MSGFVYFMLNVEERAVKVGYATDVRKRLSAIGVSCAHEIELAASVPADATDEKRMHRALRNRRMSGEWFRWDLITHELIERAQTGAPIEELIDFANGKLFTPLNQRAGCLVSHIKETVA